MTGMPDHRICARSRIVLLFVTALLSACGRVDLDALPPLPEVALAETLRGVQRQVSDAFERVRQAPGDPEPNGRLAMILQTYKQFNAADVMYRRARALDARNFEWPYLHAIVLTALGRPTEAIEAYRAALQLRGDHTLAKVHLAELLADNGDSAAAADLYSSVMATSQPPSEAYFSYGTFLLRQGDIDQAIQSFQHTIQMSGDFGAVHYQLGIAYRDRQEPSLAERHLQLAQVYNSSSADSSDDILNRLLLLNRSDQPFVQRAKQLAESGRLDDARRFIEMALERNPDSVAAHASMMGLATSVRDFTAVEDHFNKAISIEPRNAKVYFNMGLANIAQVRYAAAQRAFERALEFDNSDPNIHVQLAILSHRRNEAVAAEQYLRAAVALEPAHQMANWLLGELLLENGEAEEAGGLLRKAVQSPHQLLANMYIALARAEAQLGNWDDAFAALDDGREVAEFANADAQRQHIEQVRAELTDMREKGRGGVND